MPWKLDGGESIVYMEIIDNPENQTHRYRFCATHLAIMLTRSLQKAKYDILMEEFELEGTLHLSHGVVLLNAIRDKLLPTHLTQILVLLGDLGTCLNKNRKLVQGYGHQLDYIFKRMKQLGYMTIEKLQVVYT